jgi:Fe-S oxidoreductase
MLTNMTYFGFLPGYILFWGVFAIALGLFTYRIRQLLQYMFLGQKDTGYKNPLKWASNTFAYVFSQLCQLKNFRARDRAPLGHALMAWGFFVFVVFYFFFFILAEGFGLTGLENTALNFYLAWVMDFMSVFIIIGAGWGLIRRYIVRPDRLKGEQTVEALIILLSVFTHPFAFLFNQATVLAMGLPPAGLGHTLLPPVSAWLSHIFTGSTASIQNWHVGFFWADWLTVLFVLVYIPYSRYLHVIASIFNGIFRSRQPTGALKSIDLENAESIGAAKIDSLTWKQNLDLYACVACGNCQEQCPAYTTGKPLNPKKVIQDLKKQLLKAGPELVKAKAQAKGDHAADAAADTLNVTLAGNIIKEDEIWACTTCGACDTVCPVWVDHIDKIVDLRRNLVLEQSIIPETAVGALQSIEKRGHPWRGTTLNRTDWAKDLNIKTLAEKPDVDILYWVGCTEALEERAVKVAQATAKLMQQAGLNFGILGTEESCCGDPARRLGNEYLYQQLAQSNIEILKGYNVKKIVTACPHCYNTIKNEYPQFGGNFEVVHHTELIAGLLKEGKIKVTKGGYDKITYHDSCYLGRYNEIYQQPRQILSYLPDTKLVEMEKNKKRGFCCGGGGGRLWLEERTGQRISENRIDQVMATKAQMVATACPYCLQMFGDATKAKQAEETLKVKDIAEIIADSITTAP